MQEKRDRRKSGKSHDSRKAAKTMMPRKKEWVKTLFSNLETSPTIHFFNRVGRGVNMISERISVNPNVCHGQACIRGTRIPVYQIIRMLANGDQINELLEDYPSLKREDIFACLDYAASLAEEQITPIDIVEHMA